MSRGHDEAFEYRAQVSPVRVHEITRDFRLEDVWALPTPGRMPLQEPGQIAELLLDMMPAGLSA